MRFQNLKKKNACSSIAATFMGCMIFKAVVVGEDVFGFGPEYPFLWTALLTALIAMALLGACTLLELFLGWVRKKL